MSGLVIRLAGVEQPETRVFHQESISVGTAPTCDLSFRPDDHALPLSATLLKLRADNGVFRISTVDEVARVTRDGEAVAIGDAIRDGDTLYFGTTGVRLRFFTLSPSMELAESLQLGAAVLGRTHAQQALASSNGHPAAPRTDVALVFVKQLLRELVAEIPRRVLYVAAGIVLFIIGTIVYINTLSFLEGRRNHNAVSELKQSVGKMQEEMKQTREEVRKAREDARFVQQSLSFAARVVENYGPGVCLIYGIYSYEDPRSGREARYKEPSEMSAPIGANGTVNLSVDGSGPVYELEFIGTGFLVQPGMVLTNRHVAQPWYDDPVASMIRGQGFRPKLKEFYAYFPKMRQPFLLHPLEVGRRIDIAICSFEQGDAALPVLPIDENGEGAVNGQSVVLIGYPAGVEALLAKIDESDRMGLATSGRIPLRTLLNDLAGRTLIRPMTTQGHIGDITANRIVHDAQTSEGGSGGPIFGSNGKVIGINQAILPGTPNNYGIPIRYGIELLKKHKPDLQLEVGQNGGASPSTPASR
jgi:S1-C subfamily serine protease